MSVWRKLVTAIKGSANEAAEAVVDANLMKILDQEMREAKDAIGKARY
jgi:phage shock protein A